MEAMLPSLHSKAMAHIWHMDRCLTDTALPARRNLFSLSPGCSLHPRSAEHNHPRSSSLHELLKMTHLGKNPGSKCTSGKKLVSGGWVWPSYIRHSSNCVSAVLGVSSWLCLAAGPFLRQVDAGTHQMNPGLQRFARWSSACTNPGTVDLSLRDRYVSVWEDAKSCWTNKEDVGGHPKRRAEEELPAALMKRQGRPGRGSGQHTRGGCTSSTLNQELCSL